MPAASPAISAIVHWHVVLHQPDGVVRKQAVRRVHCGRGPGEEEGRERRTAGRGGEREDEEENGRARRRSRGGRARGIGSVGQCEPSVSRQPALRNVMRTEHVEECQEDDDDNVASQHGIVEGHRRL